MKKLLSNALIAFVSAILGVMVYHICFPSQKVVYQVQESSNPITHVSYDDAVRTGLSDFSYAAQKATPTVVHIRVIKSIKTSWLPTSTNQQEYSYNIDHQSFEKESTTGSGVIVSSDGHIVTNAHVIDGSEIIEITLSNKQKYFAEAIAIDIKTDLALLKIKGDNFPFIEFSNSDFVKVGQWVLAVGNPFNLSSTVTAGIVSAKGRNLDLPNHAIESYIQSDAAVNKGNSGGALINAKGQLVGINSAIATTSGKFEGYSFAIPANIVKKVITDLSEHGYVRRPYLGFGLRNLESSDLLSNGETTGVVIDHIELGSQAQKAGLKENDILVKINGFSINKVTDLQERISQLQPGSEVSITYLRGKQKNYTRLHLRNVQESTLSRKIQDLLGAKCKQLSLAERKRYKVENGIQIVNMSKGLLYQNTNIHKDFIITHLNNQAIYSVEHFHDLLFEIVDGQAITLTGRYPNRSKNEFFSFGMQRK